MCHYRCQLKELPANLEEGTCLEQEMAVIRSRMTTDIFTDGFIFISGILLERDVFEEIPRPSCPSLRNRVSWHILPISPCCCQRQLFFQDLFYFSYL